MLTRKPALQVRAELRSGVREKKFKASHLLTDPLYLESMNRNALGEPSDSASGLAIDTRRTGGGMHERIQLMTGADCFEQCQARHAFYRKTAALQGLPRELETICAGAAKYDQLDFTPAGGIEKLSFGVNLPYAAGIADWRPGLYEVALND